MQDKKKKYRTACFRTIYAKTNLIFYTGNTWFVIHQQEAIWDYAKRNQPT